MSIPYRGRTSASTYFVTAGVFCKMNLLQSERMATLFCEKLYEYRANQEFLVHAFVVMPNHVHLLITVREGLTLERAMQLIKGGFSREAGKVLTLSHLLSQKSFVDRRVRDWNEFDGFRKYIHHNPVNAGLTECVEGFPYSSANPQFKVDALPQRLKPGSQTASNLHR